MTSRDDSPLYSLHKGGKIEMASTVPLRNRDDLSLAYTPGVAEVCLAIEAEPDLVNDYTWKNSVVAVVTDGTAVLGLGDIGPEASLPVMEGKALLFKQFGGVNSVPIALATKDVDEIVDTVIRMAPSFGGINLEDISAPRCFEIEDRLKAALDIPVFHDDQHGTAIVALAAMKNAARLTGRSLGDLRAVVSGAGAAGVAVTKILLEAGIGDISIADSKGIVHGGRGDLTPIKRSMADITNKAGFTGTIEEAMIGADVYIGLSAGKVDESDVAKLAPEAMIFAMANPDPEIHPDVAR
ncbi:MAG TPA: malic enzyme-like NAD(P)-binding protein, partial [Mycobacteriales bacterium]|nr:malic enzyme-like NAD(P)-binding protein [Mycobacteriales bacterium]